MISYNQIDEKDDIEYYLKDFLMAIATRLINSSVVSIVITFGQNEN